MLLLNPVILSVIVLCGLCLLRVNVLLAMIIAALTAGLTGGMGISKTMSLMTDGFSSNATTALSYILLGTFAIAIANTGIMQLFVTWLGKHLGTKKSIFCFVIAFIACLSQNVIPVHIAFIPLLIPPLFTLMNRMKLDRRAISCALGFGLTAPYIALPVGFGLIFEGIVADNMTTNGMPTTIGDVASVAWILGLAMFVGLVIAIFISYRKPREYLNLEANASILHGKDGKPIQWQLKHWGTCLAIVVSVAVQLWLESLPLAGLIGIAIMIIFRALRFKDLDAHITGGISMMGFIAFVMLSSGGYALILKETGSVPALVESVVPLIGDNRWMAAFLITFIGLIVTMGIGTSFATVPILAAIYVPLCASVGFSVPATILLITAAGALGDAGSPASDSTLGPTSGLHTDGQHDHIYDTCLPTFIHYNIPLMLFAVVGAQII